RRGRLAVVLVARGQRRGEFRPPGRLHGFLLGADLLHPAHGRTCGLGRLGPGRPTPGPCARIRPLSPLARSALPSPAVVAVVASRGGQGAVRRVPSAAGPGPGTPAFDAQRQAQAVPGHDSSATVVSGREAAVSARGYAAIRPATTSASRSRSHRRPCPIAASSQSVAFRPFSSSSAITRILP